MTADIVIEGEGFFSIRGETLEGSIWVEERVAGAEGSIAYSDDQRYTQDIAEGATDEGLVVGVNGFQYLSGGARGEAIA